MSQEKRSVGQLRRVGGAIPAVHIDCSQWPRDRSALRSSGEMVRVGQASPVPNGGSSTPEFDWTCFLLVVSDSYPSVMDIFENIVIAERESLLNLWENRPIDAADSAGADGTRRIRELVRKRAETLEQSRKLQESVRQAMSNIVSSHRAGGRDPLGELKKLPMSAEERVRDVVREVFSAQLKGLANFALEQITADILV